MSEENGKNNNDVAEVSPQEGVQPNAGSASFEMKVSSCDGDGGTAKIIYILYLLSFILGVTGIIGVVMAYINKSDAPDWVAEHYRYQIRTFWIGLLYSLIGVALTVVFIGFLVLLFVMIWYIVRCIKGMKALGEQRAPANVKSWMF